MIGARVPDSLLVIDIDPRNGGSLEALTNQVGALPETLTAWSGRKGAQADQRSGAGRSAQDLPH
jgi:hypothetical protein